VSSCKPTTTPARKSQNGGRADVPSNLRSAGESFANQLAKLTLPEKDATMFSVEAMLDVMEEAVYLDPKDRERCKCLHEQLAILLLNSVHLTSTSRERIERLIPERHRKGQHVLRVGRSFEPWIAAARAYEAIRSIAIYNRPSFPMLGKLTVDEGIPVCPLEAIRRVEAALKADVAPT
jgi:hypothetical protein